MEVTHGITKEEKEAVRGSLPEVDEIEDGELREKVILSWAMALKETSFARLEDVGQVKEISVVKHVRSVARVALAATRAMKDIFPELSIDEDIVIAGALCHDLGQPFEYDPKNKENWEKKPWLMGNPAIRHPVYGVHVALRAGLPLEVVHIIGTHSMEGRFVQRSIESAIVHSADHHFYWEVIARAKYDKSMLQLFGNPQKNET